MLCKFSEEEDEDELNDDDFFMNAEEHFTSDTIFKYPPDHYILFSILIVTQDVLTLV